MKVKLLYNTPIWTIANAIRMSRNNHHLSDSVNGKLGEKDFDLIRRVGVHMNHSSTLEFGYFIFEIDEISRACLQELARHRLANLTVQSTRYTLNQLKDEESFIKTEKILAKEFKLYDRDKAAKYLVFTDKDGIDDMSIIALNNLQKLLKLDYKNDIAKYPLPEAFKTKLQWGINLRSLINFFELRLSKSALWEIRKLAKNIVNVIKIQEPEYFNLLLENEKIRKNYEAIIEETK